MSERSKAVSWGMLRGVIAFALAMGAAQQAISETYSVNRTVPPGRVTGTIETNGRLGVLTSVDILDWNLAIDANGDGTTAALVGPLSGGNSVLSLNGTALSATPAGLTWNFSEPSPPALANIIQIRTPALTVVWQLQAFFPMSDEQLTEPPGLFAFATRGPGLEQIAALAFETLEITADTTLTADHRGPVVIAADGVTLDCAYQTVVGSAKDIGIHAAGRTGVTITRCVVFNFGEGIVLEDSTQSTLSENILEENVSAGIRLTNADRNRLTGNDITYTRNHLRLANGLLLESSSKNRLEFNTVDHSDVDGIRMDAGSRFNEVVANVSSFNGGRAFNLAGASSNTVLRNTAIHNGDFGFLVQDQAKRNRLIENAACHNRAGDATEIRDSRRSNGNVWALNLFCSPSF